MTDVVVLEYADLVAGKDLGAEIAKAFGYDGLGLLAVRGVPGFAERRQRLLPLSRQFALLPDDVKAKYEHEKSFYSFGWSHGKEVFNGQPDVAKGSYYANPQYDEPVTDQATIDKYISFVHPNIWPDDSVAGFSDSFKDCGRLMVEVAEMIAEQCDRYVHSQTPSYPLGKLKDTIKGSKCCKGRLLHYFDMQAKAECKVDSWCGWHNDHGSLTALCPGMFMTADGKEVPSPDPQAGLYVHTRTGVTVKASVPTDCMAFQIGETAQIHSGGVLQATPHCVMGGTKSGFTRESFAVFTEPNWDAIMDVPEGVAPEKARMGSRKELLPAGVPMLEARWDPGCTFADFTDKTLKA